MSERKPEFTCKKTTGCGGWNSDLCALRCSGGWKKEHVSVCQWLSTQAGPLSIHSGKKFDISAWRLSLLWPWKIDKDWIFQGHKKVFATSDFFRSLKNRRCSHRQQDLKKDSSPNFVMINTADSETHAGIHKNANKQGLPTYILPPF